MLFLSAARCVPPRRSLLILRRSHPARVLVGYVCVGVLLTGLGLYDPLVRLAGCGATTPLTGFGYCLAEGVRRAVDERGLIGAFTGGLSGCAGGIAAALLSGLAAGTFAKEREK